MMINQVLALFQPRILPFDQLAAKAYAGLAAKARLAGRAISMPDAQIAAPSPQETQRLPRPRA